MSDDNDTAFDVVHADVEQLGADDYKGTRVRLYASMPNTYSLQIFARRRIKYRAATGTPYMATASLGLEQLHELRRAVDRAIADLVGATRRPASPEQTPKDRKLAMDVAREALRAVRITPTSACPSESHLWAYFAEETRSWWAITVDAMIKLADMLSASGYGNAVVIETWAEADKTAIELDKALSRLLSKEHGR